MRSLILTRMNPDPSVESDVGVSWYRLSRAEKLPERLSALALVLDSVAAATRRAATASAVIASRRRVVFMVSSFPEWMKTGPLVLRGPGAQGSICPRVQLIDVTTAPSAEGRKLLRLELRNAETPIERKPEWIKTRAKMGPAYTELHSLVKSEGLHTVSYTHLTLPTTERV